MLVIGRPEVENKVVSVRLRTEEDLVALSLEDLIVRTRSMIDLKVGL